LPDMNAETTRYAVQIPHLGSLVLTHSWNGQIPGLKDFASEDRPNSTIVFWTFRIMVGLGFLMLLLGLWGAWARWRDELYRSKLFLRFAVLMGPAGLVALLAGWFTTEIGRQPWLVYGLLRTNQGYSTNVTAGNSMFTLLGYMGLYLLLGILFLFLIQREIGQGPALAAAGDVRSGTPITMT